MGACSSSSKNQPSKVCEKPEKRDSFTTQSSTTFSNKRNESGTVSVNLNQAVSLLIPFVNENMLHGRSELIQSKIIRDAFIFYIRNENWVQQVQDVSKNIGKNCTDKLSFRRNFADESMQESLKIFISTGEHDVRSCFPKISRLSISVACAWYMFTATTEFSELQDFLNKEKENNNERPKLLNRCNVAASFYGLKQFNSETSYLGSENSFKENDTPMVTVFKKQFNIASDESLIRNISSGQWFERGLYAFDHCFVGLCIAKVEKKEINDVFPIVYVNKNFEDISKLLPSELLKMDLSALISEWNEKSQDLYHINRGIVRGRIAESYIDRENENHEKYLGFIKIEPVYDINNEYKYVICAQFDVSKHNWDSQALKAVDEALWVLRCFL